MSDHMLDAEQAIAKLRADNCRLVDDRNNWQKRAEAAERAKQQLADALQTSQQWISESNGKINVLTAERDAALTEKHCLRLELEQMRAEAEGLRADLLAHPPEPHRELAAERQRHIELMEDHDRQAVMIGILEDAVKRAENALATAQAKARQIPPALVGLLGVIRREAAAAEKMIL